MMSQTFLKNASEHQLFFVGDKTANPQQLMKSLVQRLGKTKPEPELLCKIENLTSMGAGILES